MREIDLGAFQAYVSLVRPRRGDLLTLGLRTVVTTEEMRHALETLRGVVPAGVEVTVLDRAGLELGEGPVSSAARDAYARGYSAALKEARTVVGGLQVQPLSREQACRS